MLSSAMRRYIGKGSFHDFKQCLLHALTADVACNGRVFALTRNFVNLIDIDDAALRAFDIIIRCLNQLEQDVFNILTYIARFGQRGRVRDCKGHVKRFGKRLRKQRLADARGSEKKDIALCEINAVVARKGAFIVVIDGYAQRNLGVILTDDIFVQDCLDFLWLQKRGKILLGHFGSRRRILAISVALNLA